MAVNLTTACLFNICLTVVAFGKHSEVSFSFLQELKAIIRIREVIRCRKCRIRRIFIADNLKSRDVALIWQPPID